MDHQHCQLAQTRVLKLQPNCENCERKVKRALEKIHGLHSIRIDANEGNIEVTSTIDPREFIAMATKAGSKAELLWEPKPNHTTTNHNHTQVEASRNGHTCAGGPATNVKSSDHRHYQQPCVTVFDDQYDQGLQLAQIQEFVAKNRRMKHVEFVQKKIIRMKFKDDEESDGDNPPPARVVPEEESRPPARVVPQEDGTPQNRPAGNLQQQQQPTPASSCCGRNQRGGGAGGPGGGGGAGGGSSSGGAGPSSAVGNGGPVEQPGQEPSPPPPQQCTYNYYYSQPPPAARSAAKAKSAASNVNCGDEMPGCCVM